MTAFLVVGRVLKPQGIKGEIKIVPETDDPARFERLKKVVIADREYAVSGVSLRENGVFLRLEGIDDRNAAEKLRGAQIGISREDAVKLPEGRYFIVDLIGCEVRDERGVYIGRLAEIYQYGAADVYELITKDGTAMFPALKRVISAVDLSAKQIVVDRAQFDAVAVYND